jgi:hypothetical protein
MPNMAMSDGFLAGYTPDTWQAVPGSSSGDQLSTEKIPEQSESTYRQRATDNGLALELSQLFNFANARNYAMIGGSRCAKVVPAAAGFMRVCACWLLHYRHHGCYPRTPTAMATCLAWRGGRGSWPGDDAEVRATARQRNNPEGARVATPALTKLRAPAGTTHADQTSRPPCGPAVSGS